MEHRCQEAVAVHPHLQLEGGICLQHGFRQAQWFFGLCHQRDDQFHRSGFQQRHPGELCFQELLFLIPLLCSLLKSTQMIGTEGVACHLPPRGTRLPSESGLRVE